MLHFMIIQPRVHYDELGYIPSFLSETNPLPAAKQLDEAYRHGGGWHPFSGFTLDVQSKKLEYPGDPAMQPLAIAALRHETILIYPHAWVLILQPDDTFEICRMD